MTEEGPNVETTQVADDSAQREERRRQISDMLNGGSREPVQESPEEEEEEVEEVEEEEDVVEEGVEEGGDEVEDEDEDEDEEEEPTQPTDEVASLRAQVEELRNTIAQQAQGRQTKAPEQEETPATKKVLAAIESDDEFDEITSSREKFNDFLGNFAQAVREQVIKDIPQVVGQTVRRQTELQNTVDDFYKKNEDLKPFAQFVGFHVNQVSSEHSDWALPKVLEEAATRARKQLNLQEKAQGIEAERKKKTPSGKKPAFAKKPGGQRAGSGEEALTPKQKQIKAMLDSAARR